MDHLGGSPPVFLFLFAIAITLYFFPLFSALILGGLSRSKFLPFVFSLSHFILLHFILPRVFKRYLLSSIRSNRNGIEAISEFAATITVAVSIPCSTG